jgi:uncharacterized protein (TIGR03083 family)
VTPENPDPSAAALLALNARAVRASVQVVSQVRAADLARPTPCGGWTLAQLIAHMTAQHDGVAAAAAERVLAAFGADGVLGRRFALPEISPRPFPAVQAIGFHLVDYVVHGWDVARSLGSGPYQLDPDLLSAALLIAQAVPDDERRRRPDAAFAPAVPAQDSLSPLDRIVALLGRRPHWPA